MNGKVNPGNLEESNPNAPMNGADGTMTGDLTKTPQEMGTTWDPTNKGVFIYENVMLVNGTDLCGTYRVVPGGTATSPTDFGTFTMKKK